MRNFTLFAAGLLAAFQTAMAADPIMSVDFSDTGTFSQTDFAAWTCIDANNDEKTWGFDASAIPSRVFYSYHSTNVADDWLFSPEITIPETGTYLVRFNCTGSSYGEAIEVWYGKGASVSAMSTKGYENAYINGSPNAGYFIASLTAGDKVNIGFHAVSQPNKFRLYLNYFEVKAVTNPVDLGVSEIVSPESGENLGSETVVVKVTNYATSDVNGFDIAYTINDGTPVVEHSAATIAAGQTIEYTFTTKADCSTPREKYAIKAYTVDANDVMPENDASSVVVRHIAPAGIPYKTGFEPDDDTSNFSYLNLNKDDGDWSVDVNSFFSIFSRTGSGYIAYNYDKENAADDWFFIDPLNVEAGDYLLRFWYTATTNHTERLRVCWGTDPTPDAMTNVICEINPMTNDSFKESISIFKVPTAQKIFVGFYAFSDADENWMIIDDLSIETVDSNTFDLVAGEFTEPYAYLRPANHRDVVTFVKNVSVADANATVSLYIDGVLAQSVNARIGFMENKEFRFENALAGLVHGKHTIKVEAITENDSNVDNNSTEMEIVVIEQDPALLYTFEDISFPEDLTYRVEDSATLAPGALEQFDEEGVGFAEVQDHYLYQTGVLLLCTWFTDNTRSADRYLVLPKMHINDDACHLVWDSSSFSTVNYEKYNIEVSTSDDVWYNYTNILTVTGENEYAKTRGVSLEAYAGKDIYIAFHLKTEDGLALVLDNIGIYGSADKAAGVEDVLAQTDVELQFDGETLSSNADATITVYALDGTVVAQGEGQSLDLSALSAGAYIAKAVSGADVATLKFVK